MATRKTPGKIKSPIESWRDKLPKNKSFKSLTGKTGQDGIHNTKGKICRSDHNVCLTKLNGG
jgi:hypothetical protein